MVRDAAGPARMQETLIASLLKPEAYSHPASAIEVLETHISWVVLTGPFAYKIKKAVKLDFLDFSTLQKRRHFCEEELRLNRRWAPELYLEVLPISGSVGDPVVDGEGRAIEYALKMVQFPQSSQLDKQLIAGLLRRRDLRALAESTAAFHREAPRLEFTTNANALTTVRQPMLDNFQPLRKVTGLKLVSRVEAWTSQNLLRLEAALIGRRKEGYVRECHGDLHLSNLVRMPAGIVAFDCVEFSAELRNIDVVSDIAFLVMDLVSRARQDLAFDFLNRYLECTGDYPGMDVLGLYVVYHCMIRAKVAAIRAGERSEEPQQEQDIEDVEHNLAVAARWIEAPPPRLIAMHGFSGSGKTWLSSQLMSQLPAIRIRSDIERKRFFGLDETAGSESKPGAGIYTDKATAETYAGVLDASERLLGAGFNVIVDASFLRRSERQLLFDLAGRLGIPFAFAETRATREELMRRLRARVQSGEDASEANIAVLQHQFEHADPLTAAERERTVVIETDATIDTGRIIKGLRRTAR